MQKKNTTPKKAKRASSVTNQLVMEVHRDGKSFFKM
jgi:hypothetical protein